MPTSCVSAQGGPPVARIDTWAPPYWFRVGAGELKVTVKDPWPTRHYTFTARKRGARITGKLGLSYSMLSYASFGYRILTCWGTASFSLLPARGG